MIIEFTMEFYPFFVFLVFYIIHELIIISVIFGLMVVCKRIIEKQLYRDYLGYNQKIPDLSRKPSRSDN
jgi:hypothetical protein